MKDSSKLKYWNDFYKHSASGTTATSKSGRSITAGVVSEVEDNIKAWIKKSQKGVGARAKSLKYLTQLKTPQIAFIACKSIIDTLTIKNAYTTLCRHVGMALEGEARALFLKKEAPGMFVKLKKQLKRCTSARHKRTVLTLAMNRMDSKFEGWPTEEKVRAGMVLLDIFIQTTGVVEVQYLKVSKNKTKLFVIATPAASEWLDKFHLYNEESLPTLLPMVEQPISWDSPYGGGYGDGVTHMNSVVKSKNKEYLNSLELGYVDDVYDALNTLQNTKWKLNRKILKLFKYCYDSKLPLGKICVQDPENMPSKPVDIETNEEARMMWKQQAVAVRESNIALSSKKLQMIRLNKVLSKFNKVKHFYFPYQLDFRGRAYATPHFLNPQGDDVARGLLLFSEGKRIQHKQQANWLAIHGSNMFGYDKVDFESRVNWVDENENAIISTARDPLSDRFWETADKPWQFLAFCMEWKSFKELGYGFTTHLPVHVDGSNNGLQLLSLLARDPVGAAATNCTPSTEPADIYQQVADLTNKELTELSLNDVAKAKYWLDFGANRNTVNINRKTVKKPVMTLSYGSTYFSCRAYIESWYKDELSKREPEFIDFKYKAQLIEFLAKIIWNNIPKVVGSALELMGWLRECATIINKDRMTIKWTAPTGFPVWQKYFNINKFKIKTTLSGGVTRQITIAKSDETKSSLKRQKNGISPNFIHSLDAAALMKVINLSNKFGIKDFFVVHDSYGTLCTDMEELSACIRSAHYNIFKEDLLEKLYIEFQTQTTREIPLPPARGTLDVSLLLESEYFFA